MSIHEILHERLAAAYGSRIAGEIEPKWDALNFNLENGTAVELRFASPEEYSLQWSWEGSMLRIDTAPVAYGVATSPHHLHAADGSVRADPFTVPGREPWDNVRQVVDAILQDPLVAAHSA